MQDLRRKRNPKAELMQLLRGGAILLALLLVAFFAARGAYNMYGKFAAAADADASAQRQREDLTRQQAQVGAQVAAYNTPRGVEAQVRERYGLAKPGEGQIQIVKASTSTDAAGKKQGFWATLWSAVFVW